MFDNLLYVCYIYAVGQYLKGSYMMLCFNEEADQSASPSVVQSSTTSMHWLINALIDQEK